MVALIAAVIIGTVAALGVQVDGAFDDDHDALPVIPDRRSQGCGTRAGAASPSVLPRPPTSFFETVPELAMVRFKHNERGAAAVEFAIVLPLLVLLVFGIIQFSIAYNRTQGLHAAAREGARYAALPSNTSSEIEDARARRARRRA